MKKLRYMKIRKERVEMTLLKNLRIWQLIIVLLMMTGVGFADLPEENLVAWYPFNGNAVDESGNGNNGIVIGATLAEDRFGNPDSAYFFDGLNNYINIGNNVKPPLPFTVSIWIKLESIPGINSCVFRNDRYNNASYRYGVALMANSDGTVTAHVFEGFSASWNRQSKISNDSIITIDNWHHFAVVFNAHNDMQLFWNGEEIDGYYRADGTGSGLSYSDSNGAIGLFYRNIGGTGVAQYFHGYIDDIHVYSQSLSAAQITELYNSSPVPPPFEVPPVALCQNVTVEAEDGCVADALIDDGSYDSDGDAITFIQIPPRPYALGSTEVTLIAMTVDGLSDSCTATVTVVDTTPPAIVAEVTPQDMSVGGEASFVCDIEEVCDFTVEWDFGDGHTSTDIITTHVYTTSGEYNATLTAVDSSGNASIAAFTILVSDQIEIPVDIKPGSCPNPLNVNSNGVLPVAILGTEVLDVIDIDVASISLEGVVPIRFDYEDVATPFEGELCDCHEDGPDGYLDITLKFNTQEIVTALGDVEDGEYLPLTLLVTLVDGTVLEGSDCIRIIKKGKD